MSPYLAIGTSSSKVLVFKDKVAHPFLLACDRYHRGCLAVDISRSQQEVAGGFEDGVVAVWGVNSRSIIKVIAGVMEGPVLAVRFWSDSYDRLLASDSKCAVQMLDIRAQLWSYSVQNSLLIKPA
jgi:hypothetical protein